MITLFNRVEIWWRTGAWCRPDEWVFGRDMSCASGCFIFDCGFFGFTILKNECRTIK